MAKKKNQSKKHKFKYADPSIPATVAASSANEMPAGNAGSVPNRAARSATATVPSRDFSYVGSDLRRILVLAVVLVGVEFGLWFLFTHTGVGSQVYSLVKV